MDTKLTPENYTRGALVDDQWMGGVTEHPEAQGVYIGFIMDYTTGEAISYETFDTLADALDTINQVDRKWAYEAAQECSGHEHSHGENAGGCGGKGGCGNCGGH